MNDQPTFVLHHESLYSAVVNKPIDVRFRGPEMFIVDFGVFVPAPLTRNSGKIWKVTHFRKK